MTLFIFKSNARGMQYGMGTYIRELTDALLAHTDIKIYIVTYHNSDRNELSIDTISARYTKINIPSPKLPSPHNNLFEKRYASVVVRLLYDIIPRNEKIVFQMNYINDLPIIKKLKDEYSHPVLSVVHLSQWQQLFNGNRQKLNGLNTDIPSNNIEFTIFTEKEMYRLSDNIISLNNYMKDFLVEEYGIVPDKIEIVCNGINCSKFHNVSQEEKQTIRQNLGFNPHEKIIIFSGRIDASKGIFFLLDAFTDACKYMEDLRLVLIGQGNIQECKQKYNSFSDKITFTGFLPSQQVMAYYQVADAGVFPSIYEQCSYTVLEMMAFKIPLILSKINGLNEMLEDGQCLFIDPLVSEDGELSFDIKEISNAILTLVRDKQMAEGLALEAYQRLIVKFSDTRLALEMNNVYSSIADNK